MKRTLTTTAALIAFAASGALADMHTSDTRTSMHNNTAMDAMSTEELAQAEGNLIRSRDVTGGVIYTMNEANDEGWDSSVMWDEVNTDWNEIGEIEDLVLTEDGKVTGIVAEVGGFLDVGDKHVVISVQDLNLVAVDDQTYAYVTKYNEEDLESMQSVDEGFWN
ncbi:PRC-barrel domain-containing protein [Marivita sp. S0852]|uniref:PRC-barrel domain-containing protein n=1 Tax=Marivita sp. S0852 TaxID=3373893 RepID=UPI003981DD31